MVQAKANLIVWAQVKGREHKKESEEKKIEEEERWKDKRLKHIIININQSQ